MKTEIKKGIEGLVEKICENLEQEQPIHAEVMDCENRTLFAGYHYGIEESNGSFFPNRELPTKEILNKVSFLKNADGQKFILSKFEQCPTGSSHFHFKVKP